MDADFRFPSIYVPSTCTHRARPAPVTRAGPPPGGPFNSGKEPAVREKASIGYLLGRL